MSYSYISVLYELDYRGKHSIVMTKVYNLLCLTGVYIFFHCHVWIWESDHKEGWTLKNWCFRSVVLGKTLESPLNCKEMKSVSPKGSQSWIFIRRTDAEALILWPPDVKNRLIRKYPEAGKDCRQDEKGVTEDKMAGWHHWLNGHEFEQVLGDGEGQGSLAYCSPWAHKELAMTAWLNNSYRVFSCMDMSQFGVSFSPRWTLALSVLGSYT